MYRCATCGVGHGGTTDENTLLQVGGLLLRQRVTPACAVCYRVALLRGLCPDEAWRASEMRPWTPPPRKPKKPRL